MATKTSTQSGLFTTGATWVGGVAPNQAVDTAIIASGHIVTDAIGLNLSSTGTLTINAGGTLSASNGLTSATNTTINGTLNMSGGTFFTQASGSGTLNFTGTASVTGFAFTGATFTITWNSSGTFDTTGGAGTFGTQKLVLYRSLIISDVDGVLNFSGTLTIRPQNASAVFEVIPSALGTGNITVNPADMPRPGSSSRFPQVNGFG